MVKHELPLLIHAEVTDNETDIFDRESIFIDRYLINIVKTFPGVKVLFTSIVKRSGMKALNLYYGLSIPANNLAQQF